MLIRPWEVGMTLVVVLACTAVVDGVRAHLRNICPFPCACSNGELYCDHMELQQFPFRIPENVYKVNMKDNHLRELRTEQLQHITNVTHLFLRNNRIKIIENDAFRRLSGMKAITFRDNRIRHLAPDVFKGLINLEQLSLRNNRLRYIEHIFNGLTRLRLLSLGDNKIRKITRDTFKTNKHLYVLDLHNNSIRAIGRHALHSLTYLKYLILRDNPLVSVNLDFKLNYHLELLDFTNCKLTEMVRGLPVSIRDLRISENKLTHLHRRDFRHTRKIRFLFLVHNNISYIDNDTFSQMEILYDIHLSNNSLTFVPQRLPQSLHGFFAINNSIAALDDEDFNGNANLEFLALSYNNIHTIGREAFTSLEKLRSLDLSKNEIMKLEPDGFTSTNRLELLDLSNNPLDEADRNCFKGLSNLHILQMSGVSEKSKLQPSIFEGTQNLLYFDLSNSSKVAQRFAQSPFLLDYISTVEDLNLMNDNIYTLPPSFPNHFPRLKLIKLVENPWHCDKSIYWLTRWMNNNSMSFFEEDAMLCQSPPRLAGRKISSLVLGELRNPFKRKGKIKPNVNVVDIPFTLGKNYTISMGDKDIPENFTDMGTETESESFDSLADSTGFVDYDLENSDTDIVEESTTTQTVTTSENATEDEDYDDVVVPEEEPPDNRETAGQKETGEKWNEYVLNHGKNPSPGAGNEAEIHQAKDTETEDDTGQAVTVNNGDGQPVYNMKEPAIHDEIGSDVNAGRSTENTEMTAQEDQVEREKDTDTASSENEMLSSLPDMTTVNPDEHIHPDPHGAFYLAVDNNDSGDFDQSKRDRRQKYMRYDGKDNRLDHPLDLRTSRTSPTKIGKDTLIEKLRRLALKSKQSSTESDGNRSGKYDGRNSPHQRTDKQPVVDRTHIGPPTSAEGPESNRGVRYPNTYEVVTSADSSVTSIEQSETVESELDENDWTIHSNELSEITRPTMAHFERIDPIAKHNNRPSASIPDLFQSRFQNTLRTQHENHKFDKPLLLNGENLPDRHVHTWKKERHKIRHQRRRITDEPKSQHIDDVLVVDEAIPSSSGESSGELHGEITEGPYFV